jgi:adenylosuccinate synthase
MPVVIAVGVQWGDEGKGKVVDYLTEKANLVVRFQGGNNAGHTLVVSGQKTALQLIPSGILRKDTRCLLASGVVLNPFALLEEIDGLAKVGIEVTPERLGIAGEVQLILPYHQAIDIGREVKRQGGKIGTTGRGIGPAYEDAVSRYGIRLIDLFNSKQLKELIDRNVTIKNQYLESVLQSAERFHSDEIYTSLQKLANRIKPYLTNVSIEVESAVKAKQYIVFEGAQGCLLDINQGTYPYVTSSNTLSGYACVSAGFSPRDVDYIVGICKAYCTRVGSGPFPTEDFGEEGEKLRARGKEFGTVTGRPRRCGWFDVLAVRQALRLNGINSLVLTKLDVLSGYSKLKIGISYLLDGRSIDSLPASASDIDRVEVQYEEVDGWAEDISHVRSYDELPQAAKNFISRIEELTNCSVGGFSIGPEREQTIIRDSFLREYSLMEVNN